MTRLIELHDHNIRISSPQGLLGESPGFASTAIKAPVYGQEALKLNRLHPQQNFNQFWSQLSLDPLVNKNKFFRHQADLAYGHLTSLTEEFGLEGKAVFAVPSHYSGAQLATLLGLVRHSSINAVGLADLSLLALAGLQEHEEALFMDVQLHQTVLTRVLKEHNEIVREKVLPIPGAGLMAMYDSWAGAITDAFIKQSRFDPLHNADTEQYIYNELQKWLGMVTRNKEIMLEINNKGTVHQAALTLNNFAQRARNIFSRISQELDSIAPPGTQVFTLARFASLPGLSQAVGGVEMVDNEVIAENAFRHLDLIRMPDAGSEALKLVTRLPLAEASTTIKPLGTTPGLPSHFLFNHRAYAMPDLNLPELNLAAPIRISLQEQGYCLHNNPELDLELNGQAVTEPALLKLGDSLTVNKRSTIEFIQVQ